MSMSLIKHNFMKTYRGLEVWFHTFLSSALEVGGWSASRADRFTSRGLGPWPDAKLLRCGDLLPNWCYKLSFITTEEKTSNPTSVSHFSHDVIQNESFIHVRRKNVNSIIVEHSGASLVLQLAMQNKNILLKFSSIMQLLFLYLE
jgi:hypothetical protein